MLLTKFAKSKLTKVQYYISSKENLNRHNSNILQQYTIKYKTFNFNYQNLKTLSKNINKIELFLKSFRQILKVFFCIFLKT